MATPLSMVFDLVAVDRASAVFSRVGEAATVAGAKTESGMAKVAAAGAAMAKGFALAGVAATVISVKMAADFQTATNQLVTSAGETEKNLGLVRKGLLEMAGQVGVSATELAKGMYQVESAGFHGAKGLDVMRAAAEGAKAEGANMETVANALTTVLNNYGKDVQNNAVKGTDFLVASVSLGKTRMEDFAGSISNVLPVAKAVGLSLGEVGGAMATMTSEGISSDQAATYLRQTIVKLADQTPKAKNEMKALGLESINVAGHLGKVGLAGTLQELTDAIARHLGPQGLVMLDSLKKAGQNAQQFQSTLTNLPAAAQTYIGALTTMVGGQKTMMGALALTGDHMATFVDDTAKINAAMDAGKGHVNGWEVVQGSFNQKLSEFKAGAGAMAIEVGTKLLPALTSAFGWLADKGLPALKSFGDELGKLAGSSQFQAAMRDLGLAVVAFALGIKDVVNFIGDHSDTFGLLASAAMGGAAAFAAWSLAVGAWGVVTRAGIAIQAAFNVVMDANPVMLVVIGIAALAAGLIYAYTHFKGFREVVDSVFSFLKGVPHEVEVITGAVTGWFARMYSDVTGWFSRMWHDVEKILGSIAGFLKDHWRLLLTIVTLGTGLIYVVVQDHWKQISGVFSKIYDAVTGWSLRMWHDVTSFFTQMGKDVLGVVLAFVKMQVDAWTRLWAEVTGLVKRLWSDTVGAFKMVAAEVWAVIGPFVERIVGSWLSLSDRITGSTRNTWGTVKSFFGSMRDDVVGIFQDIVARVGAVWDHIKDIMSNPIRIFLDTAYNHGIVSVWNAIGGVLHESGMHLDPIHFAAGGKVPGSHSRDDVPIYATPGEVVVPLPVVARFGGADALMGALGIGGGGGAGGHYGIGGVISGAAGAVMDAAGSVTSGLVGLARGAMGFAVRPAVSGFESLADGAFGGMGTFGGVADKIVHAIGDRILAFVSGKDAADLASGPASGSYGGAPGGAGGAARWRSIVDQVLALLGQPLSLDNGVLSLINMESGGNPDAVNLSDSNAAAGHPSRGLMQTIPSTFAAYAGQYASRGITDPFANIFAGVSYALKNYGAGMLAAGGRHNGNGGYIGYELGTSYVPQTGLAVLHQGEAVLTKEENARRRDGIAVTFTGDFNGYTPDDIARATDRKLHDSLVMNGLR